MDCWAVTLFQECCNMAYGKTVSDVFQKFLGDNDRKQAEGADRNMQVARLKQQQEQQDQAAAMDRFNQAFQAMKAEEAQNNRAVDLEREDASISRAEAIRAENRANSLEDLQAGNQFKDANREDSQAHALELAGFNNQNKLDAAKAKENEKNKPKSVTERFLALNGEQGKAVNSTIMALQGVDDAVVGLTGGANTFSAVGDNEYTQARARFVEGLARMQTGAAISADEEKRFVKMLPTIGDNPKIRAKKFNDMRLMLQGRLRRYGFERGDFEELSGPNSPAPVMTDEQIDGMSDEDAIKAAKEQGLL